MKTVVSNSLRRMLNGDLIRYVRIADEGERLEFEHALTKWAQANNHHMPVWSMRHGSLPFPEFKVELPAVLFIADSTAGFFRLTDDRGQWCTVPEYISMLITPDYNVDEITNLI